MPVASPTENAAEIRAALLDHVARTLAPLDGAPSRAELDEWIAGAPTVRLIDCLGYTPRGIAARLHSVLGTIAALPAPIEAIANTVRSEFPELAQADSDKLARFAHVVRELTIERGGATAAELFARNFASAEVARLMPRARRVLDVIGGVIPPRDAEASVARSPLELLREAGTRAAVRAVV